MSIKVDIDKYLAKRISEMTEDEHRQVRQKLAELLNAVEKGGKHTSKAYAAK